MSKDMQVVGVKPLTVGQHHSAIRRAHRAGETGQVNAGRAVVAAIAAGALSFERKAPEGSPEGAHTRSTLAAFLGTSPTTVSKYRSLGWADALGYKPGDADWPTITGSHSAAWLVEALSTGKRAVVDKALADHRKGNQTGSGGQKNGQTSGKGTGSETTDGPAPKVQAETDADPATTRKNVEARVAGVAAWMTRNDGKSLTGLSVEALDSILANLTDAREAVEAAIVARKGAQQNAA